MMTTPIKASAIVLTIELAAVLFGVDLAGQSAATKDEYQRNSSYRPATRATSIRSSERPPVRSRSLSGDAVAIENRAVR